MTKRHLGSLALAAALALGPAAPARADDGAGSGVPSVPALIDAAADEFHVDPVMLRRTAWCESRWQPWATSPWGHRGLMQFNRITWAEQAPTLGLSPDFAAAYDPESNVRLAAALIARGQRWRWACR